MVETKIFTAPPSHRVIFAVTNHPEIYFARLTGVSAEHWYISANRLFSAKQCVNDELVKQNPEGFSAPFLSSLSARLVSELDYGLRNVPATREKLRGKIVFEVVLIRYDQTAREAQASSLKVRVTQDAKIVAEPVEPHVIRPDDRAWLAFGESTYLIQHVAKQGAEGRKYLSPGAKLWTSSQVPLMSERTAEESVRFACELIAATEKTMQEVPSASGIQTVGGTPRILALIGNGAAVDIQPPDYP